MESRKPLISVEELRELAGNEDLRILDCRFDLLSPQAGRKDWLSGHIPGAAYADLDRDLAGPVDETTGRHPMPSIDDFSDFLCRSGISNRSSVVVYDDSGGAIAARAWWLMRCAGHTDVRVLDGGFSTWKKAGLALERGEPGQVPGNFSVLFNPDMILSLEELQECVAGEFPFQLLDARPVARFEGLEEPIDTVAGHVPGAINLPFDRFLENDGRWKNTETLRAIWVEVTDGTDDCAVMCGSGVTACHLAISAELAGLQMPRLYVGSWSEWIRDPGRPIAGKARP